MVAVAGRAVVLVQSLSGVNQTYIEDWHVPTEEVRLSKHFMCAKHSCDMIGHPFLAVHTYTILYMYAHMYCIVLFESCSYMLTNMNTIASYTSPRGYKQGVKSKRPPTAERGLKIPTVGLSSFGSLNMTLLEMVHSLFYFHSHLHPLHHWMPSPVSWRAFHQLQRAKSGSTERRTTYAMSSNLHLQSPLK